MAILADQYKEALFKLQPPGSALSTQPGSLWDLFIGALAQEFARVDSSIDNLILEGFPTTTTALLPDWEREYGLPDPCSGLGETIGIRRKDLLAKITATGGSSAQYFIDVAAALGYQITIKEFDAFRVGESSVGDEPMDTAIWEYTWQVNSGQTTVEYFRTGQNSAGDRLATFGNQRLECVISQRKPAHTNLLFSYSL